MKTKARVLFTSNSTGLVAAETSTGSVTVFDLLGGEWVQPGDILSGDMEELDTQEIYNETRDEEIMVFIHERGMSVHEAAEKHFAQATPTIMNKWKALVSWLRLTKLPSSVVKYNTTRPAPTRHQHA